MDGSGKLGRALAWATEYADRIDPLARIRENLAHEQSPGHPAFLARVLR